MYFVWTEHIKSKNANDILIVHDSLICKLGSESKTQKAISMDSSPALRPASVWFLRCTNISGPTKIGLVLL